MKQLFKEKRGSAIITVLIVMGVLTLLGAAILQYSVNDNLQVHNDEKRMQAHYLARSGAEAVANYIMNHSDEVDELVGNIFKKIGTIKISIAKTTIRAKTKTTIG
jgi:type II secretory pathway component PulK